MRAAREVALVVLAATVTGAAIVAVGYGSGYRARWDLCVVAGLAAGICWRLARLAVPPADPLLPRPDREPWDDGWLPLSSLESRLSWGTADADRFRERLRPVLTELAADRLRSRRGVDPHTQPEHARRILGEPLWQLMTGPTERSPSRAELVRMVEALERI